MAPTAQFPPIPIPVDRMPVPDVACRRPLPVPYPESDGAILSVNARPTRPCDRSACEFCSFACFRRQFVRAAA